MFLILSRQVSYLKDSLHALYENDFSFEDTSARQPCIKQFKINAKCSWVYRRDLARYFHNHLCTAYS